MLVGTPTTGFPTSPPTTDGSAPSIPAATTSATQRSRSARRASSRCRPATPTSYTRTGSTPITSSVAAASSHTGMSLVPAQQTATGPRAGSSIRPLRSVRETGS